MRPSNRLPRSLLVCAALTLGGAACRGGCAGPPPGAPAAAGRLAPFPVDTRVVAAFDFAKLRASPLGDALAELAAETQADRDTIAAFARRTGFDPWRDTDSLVVAFPEDARVGGQFGLVLRARNLDERRLVAYAREQAEQRGGDLLARRRGQRTLWSRKGEPDLAGFFLDDRTFALGAGGWAERMADLSQGGAPSGSAATNLDLARLCERVAVAPAAIWAAALIPEGTRRTLQAEGRFQSAASMARLAAALDLGHGLSATLLGDLGSPADAQALAAQISASVRDAKKNPEVLMLGLGPYLDGVAAEASGASFTVRAALTDAQVRDLLARASAYLKLARAGQAPGFRRP